MQEPWTPKPLNSNVHKAVAPTVLLKIEPSRTAPGIRMASRAEGYFECRAGNYNSVDGSAHWEGDELLQRGAGLSSNPGGELRTRGMRDSCMTGWGVEACRSHRAPSVNRRSSKQNILPHGKPDTFKYCGRGPGMFYISPPMRSSESIFLILALACSILGLADV